MFCFFIFSITFRVLTKTCFWLVPGGLEGVGSSGRLIGSISTYPGTCKCPWSRVIAKTPPGGIFVYRLRYKTTYCEKRIKNISAKKYFWPEICFNSALNYSFSKDFEVLEGWKSSGRPVGKCSTKFRLKWSSW